MILYLKKRKIRFFDILLFLFILFLLTSGFFLLFRTNRELTITVKVNQDNVISPNQGVSSWYANLFMKGMQEKDTLGKPIATIASVREYDSAPSKKTAYLTLKIKAVYNPRSRQYTFDGRPVLIGSTIPLTLDKVYIESALIIDVQGYKKPYSVIPLLVTAQLINNYGYYNVNMGINNDLGTTGVFPFIADSINVGDTIKDTNNHTILEVVGKKVEDAKKITETTQGEALLTQDPLTKDVTLQIKIDTYKIGDRYYFYDDIPILIGSFLPIHLDTISVWPTVIKIEAIK